MTGAITVIGAGSVGVGTALHLQQRGWKVTLIDRLTPASETSFGNAGVVNSSCYIPLNNHQLWKSLPKYLLNNHAEVRYSWARALKELPWLFHFLKLSTPKHTRDTARALFQLSENALDEHRALMQRTGNMHRLSENGWLKIHRKKHGYDTKGFAATFYQQYGINAQPLTADEIYELEPSLNRIFHSGYLLTDSTQVTNPGQLIKEYAQQFVKDGGTILKTDVHSISESNHQFKLHGADNTLKADNLLIAAGAWSADLLQPLGYNTLLSVERGYHQHFYPRDGAVLNRTLQDMDAGYVLAPMENSIRLTTGVELVQRDAPPNYAQLNQVTPKAYEAFPLQGPTQDPIWKGSRPTLPDSRPIIDKAPGHKNLWLAFGHQHIGFMTGPVTGKLITQLICGDQPDIDLTPFRATRWVSRKK